MKTTVARLRRGIAFGRSDGAVRLAAVATMAANGVLIAAAASGSSRDLTWAPIALGIGIIALAAFLRPVEPAPGEKFSVAAAVTYFGAVVMPPYFAVTTALGASIVAKAVQRRSLLSAAVNTAQAGGATAAGAVALDALRDGGAAAIAFGASAYLAVTLGSVALMIVAAQGPAAAWSFIQREAVPTAALVGIGGVAGLAWSRDPLAIVLFIPALAAIEIAVRRPARQRSATAAAEGTRRGTAVDAAHEIRTPLATLVSDLSYIRTALPQEEAEALTSARHQARRLSALVDRLLLLGRAEALGPAGRSALVAVAVGRAVAPFATQERVGLVVDVPGGLRAAVPDDLLESAVRDLVANAMAYTREGLVRVTASNTGQRVAISVSDTGIGIEPDELPHVFERFFRGRRASHMSAGTGLGLSIVRRIVESCGGEVVIRSEVDRGTEITLLLPRAEG